MVGVLFRLTASAKAPASLAEALRAKAEGRKPQEDDELCCAQHDRL
jgi:hypothetical protein